MYNSPILVKDSYLCSNNSFSSPYICNRNHSIIHYLIYKNMNAKKFKSVFMLTILLATVAVFSSCSKDDEPAAKDVREDWVGSYRTNWECTVNGQKVTGTYTLTIMKSATNSNDIILNNIDDSNESVRATVNGNAMTIPQQTIQSTGISGSGTLNGNVLNFSTMETETGGTSINISQTATKQ